MPKRQTFTPNSAIGQFFMLLPLLDKSDSGVAVEALIEKLDKLGGDPDLDDDDDREPDDDGKGDLSWTEWHGRSGAGKRVGSEPSGQPNGSDDDEAYGDETDGNHADDEECASHRLYGSGPGCIYSDPDKGVDDEGEVEQGW